jgi:hypothetical protein
MSVRFAHGVEIVAMNWVLVTAAWFAGNFRS